MITKEQINKSAPPIKYSDDGSINVVLALVNPETFYCPTNTYLPAWQVVNTSWYNNNLSKYLGWIELEQ